VASGRHLPASGIFEIDPDRDTWVRDHCPNYILPVMPMMDMANRLAQVAADSMPGRHITGLRDLQVRNWAILDRVRRFRALCSPAPDGVLARLEIDQSGAKGQFEVIATARVLLAAEFPPPPPALPALRNAVEVESPYESGALTHGPAFHVLRSLSYGERGATAILDAGAGTVPGGLLPVALLDGALHAIPNDNASLWSDAIPSDRFIFPCGLSHITFHSPPPVSGLVLSEVRFDGMERGLLPAFRIQLSQDGVVWADLRSIHLMVPKAPIGLADGRTRRSFLLHRVANPSLGLSIFQSGITRLRTADVRQTDWLPGTVAAFFRGTGNSAEITRQVAIKEHVGRLAGEHPSRVVVAADLKSAVCESSPLRRWFVHMESVDEEVSASGVESRFDFDAVRLFWKKSPDSGTPSLLERLLEALCQRFVGGIRLEDAESVRRLRGVPVLFLANHQTLLEPALFSLLAPAVMGSPIMALARIEQKQSLLIQTMARLFSAFPELPHEPILYFDQSDPASLFGLTERLRTAMSDEGRSGLIHIEGARNLSCRTPVRTISSALIELAIASQVPIVPVRFTGGLPVEPAAHKIDLPTGLGKQDYWIGKPIWPEQLRDLSLIARKSLVLRAINDTGVPNATEIPSVPDSDFVSAVELRMKNGGIGIVEAALLECAKIESSTLEDLFH
jgi:1-acyl-sn-glycerol-3-phosphate acyltransferase